MHSKLLYCVLFLALFTLPGTSVSAQTADHSVAKDWNEQLLDAIRNDFARPVVHARNLYHVSAAMYDCWSLINRRGTPALIGDQTLPIDYELVPTYADREAAAREAISFAAYRLLRARYGASPGVDETYARLDALMDSLGYDSTDQSLDYATGSPAALGNYVAGQILEYGAGDNSNEANDFVNLSYPDPVNPPLNFSNAANIFGLLDPTRWQSLRFPGQVIDQAGNPVGGDGPLPFLGAEWGSVAPFAMDDGDRSMADPEFQYGNSFVYHDPGPPPVWTREDTAGLEEYRWNFTTVLNWSSHLDPADGVQWNISPGARGNLTTPYPTTFAEFQNFYPKEGNTPGADGHSLNPVTAAPYAPNVVPRGDYTRVLAEFWADGPDSETPPGHWFAIWNEVMDHPQLERRLFGEGPELGALEYEVKTYLALGGAMHDAAISAWSIKGAYDYIRPISAVRWLSIQGQCTDSLGRNFSQFGLALDPGYIEPLSAPGELRNSASFAQVQAKGWIAPDAMADPDAEVIGVDWMNPTLWLPYQRQDFITPSFAGYVSGHSTYSSAAAHVLEAVTGTPYFPGGLAEFVAEKDSFLAFERGPSVDVTLQWATYRDAADESGLSRIWGGIHPPVDDAPGRRIGIAVGTDVVTKVEGLFEGNLTSTNDMARQAAFRVYPNPVVAGDRLFVDVPASGVEPALEIIDLSGRVVATQSVRGYPASLSTGGLLPGVYFVRHHAGGLASKVVVL